MTGDEVDAPEVPEVPLDNPAGRLVHFMRKMSGNPAGRIDQSLAKAFDLDWERDRAALIQRFAAVWQLVDELENAIASAPDISRRYLTVLPEVRNYLESLVGMNGGVPQNVTTPSHATLAVLELCADDLSKRVPGPYPSAASIDELRRELRRFIDLVRDADIEIALATFLLNELHRLESALDEFFIAGTAPARDAMARLLGDIQLCEGFADTEENREAVSRFRAFLDKYASVIGLTVAANQIAQTVLLALPPGSSPHH